MLAPVSPCAGECRFVRGDSVGNYAADPDLWGFCGTTTPSSTRFPGHQEHPGNANGAARRAGPDRGASFSAAASSCGTIMLSRTTGTCASCYRRHARHLDPLFAHGVRCGLGGDGLVAGSFAALSALCGIGCLVAG